RQESRPRKRPDVFGHLEKPMGATSFGMDDTLRYAFPVEVLHLLHCVVVVQHRRTARSDGQGSFVTRSWDTGISRRIGPGMVTHPSLLCSSTRNSHRGPSGISRGAFATLRGYVLTVTVRLAHDPCRSAQR